METMAGLGLTLGGNVRTVEQAITDVRRLSTKSFLIGIIISVTIGHMKLKTYFDSSNMQQVYITKSSHY